MSDIQVKIDMKKFRKEIRGMEKQLNFAASRALNDTAKDVQKGLREHLHEEFVIRRQAFIDRSIKITKFAKKTSLSATIAVDPPGGADRDVLSIHVSGGKKTAPSGGNVAIPTETVRPDVKKVIPKGKRPRNLKKSFVKPGNDNGEKLLFVKQGRGTREKVRLAYVIRPFVKIEPRFQFHRTANEVVARSWEQNFEKAWRHAVATAK